MDKAKAYELFFPKLVSFMVYRGLTKEEAEDETQNAFLTLYEKYIIEPLGEKEVINILWQIAEFKINNYRKKRKEEQTCQL